MTSTTVARGSIIIPAHNEASVIGRTLAQLSHAADDGVIEVIVVCNGCTDRTADVARTAPGVRVIEIAEASKTAALNTGDRNAGAWPRIYLDADIVAGLDSLLAVIDELESSSRIVAARPTALYDTANAHFLVASYYRARTRIPSLHSALWGAGVYALNKVGHESIGGQFPNVIGDDLFVDSHIDPQQKAILETQPVIVRTPQRPTDLIRVLRRNHQANTQYFRREGTDESAERVSDSTKLKTLRNIGHSLHGPHSMLDALIFLAFATISRVSFARRDSTHLWQRDESSRTPIRALGD